METISLYLIAVGLFAIGCVATVLSAYIVPLSIRARGQAHGRFAWLAAAQPCETRSTGRRIGGPGLAADSEAPGLIVA
jgi:hypothetical protein